MAVKQLPLLRQSERGVFKRCQWAWYQEYVNGLRPIVEKGMELAEFGTIWHVCMAEYYVPGKKRGIHPAETWQKLAKDVVASIRTQEVRDDELIAKWEDFYELGLELADAYVERYQGDPHWEILDAERRFDVAIPDVRVPRTTSVRGRRVYTPIVILVGTIDLCMRDLNQEDKKGRPVVKMLDHKTVGRIEKDPPHLILDEQASTYISTATHTLRSQGLIEKDEAVRGMEYNFILRKAIDNRPRNEQGLATNKPFKRHYEDAVGMLSGFDPKWKIDQMAAFAKLHGITVYGEVSADQDGDNFYRYFVPRTPKERERQIVRISEEARVMDMVRTGQLPILKTPTKDCRYCKFFDMCELDEGGSLDDYFIETTMKKFDPYQDHREGADNSKKVTDGGSVEG